MKIHLIRAVSQFKRLLLQSVSACFIALLFTYCGINEASTGLLVAEEFSVTVEEGLPSGTIFGSVDVSNSTGQNITFVLESQTPFGAISMDATTGALTVADAQLFAENQSPISAVYSVIAEDGERDASTITVTVIPVDPNKDRTSFITTWRTFVADETITIPTFPGLTYNYTVDWGDGNISSNQTGNATHTYGVAGVYEVSVRGEFPAIYFNFGTERSKILTIEQWGNIEWTTMQDAFEGCSNLTYNALDAPDLSRVTNMARMFSSASQFNGFIGTWDVSNVTDMNQLFRSATTFDQDINAWDVSNVTNMQSMFERASSFNKPLNNWDVSSVTRMSDMFENTNVFNQPIGDWDVSSVTTMINMFESARVFNQPIGDWDVSNVTSMSDMFEDAIAFNQPLNDWDVSRVTTMREMFDNAASFNQSLNDWDVGNVRDMGRMFERARSFNQPLATWDVSSATSMWRMFINATAYNQDLSGWAVGGVTNCSTFNLNSGLDAANLPNFTSCTP